MTKDEMRQKVAKACGWTRIETHYGIPYGIEPGKENPAFRSDSWCGSSTLNACREMEEALQPGERSHYQHALDKVCATSKDPHCSCWDFIHATAAQRCEAFLRVKGLWKD